MPVAASEYMHPADKAALDTLRAVPLLTPCMEAFLKFLPERVMAGLNMAEKVRLGPRQLPDIYRHLPPVCEQLGIAEPELYLQMDPNPNAYTQGNERVFLTLTSGLVEGLSETE